MKNSSFTLSLCAAGLALAFFSMPVNAQNASGVSQPEAVSGEVIQSKLTVTAVDRENRLLTLKNDDGNGWEVAAGDQVRNFNQIEVGDTVDITYARAILVELKKTAGQKNPRSLIEQTQVKPTAKIGEKPSGIISEKITAVLDVITADPQKQILTLKDPFNRITEMKLSSQDQIDQLRGINTGDQVEVTYTRALILDINKTEKQ